MLQSGYLVICDRFYDSTIVYQGLLKHVSIEDIMKLKYMTIGNIEPDLTIILDVDSNISSQRLATRNLIQDEYDTMKKEQHDIIRKGFQNITEIFSFRTQLIQASGNERTVFSKILKAIEKKFGFFA